MNAMNDLRHPLCATAAAAPQQPVAISGSTVLTAAEAAAQVAAIAGELAGAGIQRGDRVILAAPAGIEAWMALQALAWLDAAAVLVDPVAPPAAVRDVQARIWWGPKPPPPGFSCLPWPPRAGMAVEPTPWAWTSERAVIFSSGSTGAPRAQSICTRQMVLGTLGSAARLGHIPGERWLSALAPWHVGGWMAIWRPAILGAAVEMLPRWSARVVAERLASGEVAVVPLVPTMLADLLALHPRPWPPALRVMLVGGDATPDAMAAEALRLGWPLARSWGMTETASQVATTLPGDPVTAAAGLPPLPFVTVNTGNDGRLHVAGPTAATGGVLSSDRGALLPDGRVRIDGRCDTAILRGGETIDPAVIEAALRAHPQVQDALVVGIPDDRLGQRPAALVVATSGELPADLSDFVAITVGRQLRPDPILVVTEIPRSTLGKPMRSVAAEWLSAASGGR